MRKILLCCAIVFGITPLAHASNVGVSVGVNIGGPSPVYVNPPVVIERPPLFLLPPRLGFYVAAGVGYDMFYLGNRYYLNNGNIWYSSPYYNGPWVTVSYNAIPYQIRRYPINRIHYYRDVHYRKYRYEKDRYHYKHFQPKYRDYRPAKIERGPHGGPPPGHGGYPPGHGGNPPGHGGGGHGRGPR